MPDALDLPQGPPLVGTGLGTLELEASAALEEAIGGVARSRTYLLQIALGQGNNVAEARGGRTRQSAALGIRWDVGSLQEVVILMQLAASVRVGVKTRG